MLTYVTLVCIAIDASAQEFALMSQSVAGSRPEWVSDSLYPLPEPVLRRAGRPHALPRRGIGRGDRVRAREPELVLRVPPSRRQAQGSVPLRRARPPGVRSVGAQPTARGPSSCLPRRELRGAAGPPRPAGCHSLPCRLGRTHRPGLRAPAPGTGFPDRDRQHLGVAREPRLPLHLVQLPDGLPARTAHDRAVQRVREQGHAGRVRETGAS